MEKQSTSKSSPTSESRTYSIHDPPGYIKPSLQDLLITDITAEQLLKHFADVNVLGADFLVKNGLTLKANYSSDICTLMVDENE